MARWETLHGRALKDDQTLADRSGPSRKVITQAKPRRLLGGQHGWPVDLGRRVETDLKREVRAEI